MQTDRMPYSIFMLKEKDAPALAALEAECFSTAWDKERYAALLRAAEKSACAASAPLPAFCVFGLRDARGGLEAYISLGLPTGGEAEIYNIAVRKARRGLGLGRRLLRHALEQCALANFCRIFLEVRTGNAAALALYTGAGFQECGRRKRYYADTGEDALVLTRALP